MSPPPGASNKGTVMLRLRPVEKLVPGELVNFDPHTGYVINLTSGSLELFRVSILLDTTAEVGQAGL